MNIFYSVPEYSDARFCVEVNGSYSITDEFEASIAAELCAEDYHNEHDGWDCDWPINIEVFETEEGPCVGKFCIERDYDPVFIATRVKDETK